MLEAQGKLRISFALDRENRRGLPYAQLLEAEGGGRRIIFDLSDGYGSVEKRAQPWLAERADVLFRRSFSPAETAKLPPELRDRVRPWGFHFHVSCPGNPMDQATSLGERRGELFQRIFNGAPRSYFTLEKFERPPEWKREPSVLFYTRLWHVPEGDELSEQVAELNRSRLELVAELKRRYGRRFTGGVQFDPRAVRRYGGLMSGVAATSRRRYLETMHRADICVGSTGLHGSIGWKTAEYLAASKAVVNETLQFEVPGPFRAEVNYLPFTDVEGCLAQVERLMADPDRTYAMAQANQAYYQSWGRPDRVMANALAQVFPEFECEVGNG